jgi:integrase
VEAAERDDQGNHLRPPGSFIAPMVRLGLDTGLRIGEVLGLRWGPDGIDLDAGLVRVTQSIDRKLDRDLMAYRVIESTSAASRRRHGVPLSPETVQVMRAHRLATGRPADGQLVWAQEDGRPVPPQGKARSAWRRVRKAVGLPDLRFHDLRHNYATHQLASGTSIHAAADLLGHADAGLVLRRHGHAVPEEVATSATQLATYRASHTTSR